MCGLAGYWSGRAEAGDAAAMADALTHRGPDAGGVWADPAAGLALGHRRLAILDLTPAGAQPMVSPSGRFVGVFNGEVYNHLSLRRELEGGGPPIEWAGHSDTETLLRGIERWGLAATLQRATGMWAVALWDRRERRLQLARDRIGEKPLYWGWHAGRIVFASELKALRALPDFDPPVDEAALALFLRYGYVPAPHSILQRIWKLEPGVVATIDAAALADPPAAVPMADGAAQPGIRIERYWSLGDTVAAPTAAQDDATAVDGLAARLTAAVREQSVADVPLGAFLSGGIDSSLIVALMRQVSDRVQTFTIGFSEAGFDEAPYARAIAAHLATDHHELYLTADDVMAVIPSLPTIYDEPFADSSQLPTILVSRLSRQHVTVALSGDAGDELFGGYNRYLTAERMRRLRTLPRPVQRALGGALGAIPPRAIDALTRLPGVPNLSMAGVKAHKLARMLQTAGAANDDYAAATAVWPGPVPLAGARHPVSAVDTLRSPRTDAAERMMHWDAASYLPDDILTKVDRAAMSTSLETRVPFLDHRVVEYAWTLPLTHKLRGGQGKWVLRQLLDRHVPRALIDRPKAGFAIPLGSWLRGPLRGWAEALLADVAADGRLDIAAIRERWRAHLAGTHDWSAAIWVVLMFQAWHNAWRAGAPAATPHAAGAAR